MRFAPAAGGDKEVELDEDVALEAVVVGVDVGSALPLLVELSVDPPHPASTRAARMTKQVFKQISPASIWEGQASLPRRRQGLRGQSIYLLLSTPE